MNNSARKAIIWDFGGVFTTSPFDAFARFESDNGLPPGFLRSINATNPDTNAWAKLERAEITQTEFDSLFSAESQAAGHRVPGSQVLRLLLGQLRPRVVAALTTCKGQFKTGCITNNMPWAEGDRHAPVMAASAAQAHETASVFGLFDHVIESAKAGLRKPDPRIYALMCEALDVEPSGCVFLDDLGINLKPARAMGMATIKVTDENQLLADLSVWTGLNLA